MHADRILNAFKTAGMCLPSVQRAIVSIAYLVLTFGRLPHTLQLTDALCNRHWSVIHETADGRIITENDLLDPDISIQKTINVLSWKLGVSSILLTSVAVVVEDPLTSVNSSAALRDPRRSWDRES